MRYITALLLCFFLAPLAPAAITYDMFFRAGVFDGLDADLTVDANSTIGGVEIVLRETTTAGEDSVLEDGMRGVAVDILSTRDNSFANLAANSAFQFAGNGADEDTLSAFNFSGTVASNRVSSDVVEFTLGTIDLIAPAFSESTTFSLADVDPNNPNLQTATGSLDSVVTFRTLTITAIPEPSAFLVLAGIGVCVSVRRRRRD